MATPSAQEIDLDRLRVGLPGLTPEIGALFAQASRVCLFLHHDDDRVMLIVEGSFTVTFDIRWSEEITQQMLDAWRDEPEVTEFGACGIAILLVLALTEYTVIRRARKGEQVDYWLGHRDAVVPFQDAARMEISGILKGDRIAIQSRVRAKQQQAAPFDDQMPTHIIVVEFGQPTAHYLVKP